jgi:hypothetical protein
MHRDRKVTTKRNALAQKSIKCLDREGGRQSLDREGGRQSLDRRRSKKPKGSIQIYFSLRESGLEDKS